MNLRERFALFGYLKVSGLLAPSDLTTTLDALGDVTGYTPQIFPGVLSKQIPSFAAHNYGLEIPVFRKLATNPKLLQILRDIVGPQVAIIQDGISAMWTAAGYHRDSHFPMERFSDEPIFADSPDRHAVTRVLFYFLPPGVQTRLAVMPCSHKPAFAEVDKIGDLQITDVTKQETWLPLNNGDCVIFDSRLRHMGPPLSEPRYMINYTYSLPNDLAREEWYYRHNIRPDLGMEPWSAPVEADLRACGLWFEDPERPELTAAFDLKYKDTPRGNAANVSDRVISKSLRPSRYLAGSKYEYMNDYAAAKPA